MSQNRFKYFRWTPRTAWLSFVYMAVVPSLVGVVAYSTDVRTNMTPATPPSADS